MIKARYSDILNSLSHKVFSNYSNSSSDGLICWNPPPEHQAKLNVDGSFYSHNNNATCGGLEIAIDNNIQHVIVESDSLAAIKFVQEGCHTGHPCLSLLEDIKIQVWCLTLVSWCHTLREGNHVADSLAKKG
ncbi:hypothetical protein PIB30_013819 [Stylosanthes scabra]|uniref:RNase H type-1 domain-containing protein n=1 Tax=Stylosanthes scabra TaxID=79078 RepID=A0ABU6S613_9FABA|nr:hypothetical protein [Stylosanthes scabra]